MNYEVFSVSLDTHNLCGEEIIVNTNKSSPSVYKEEGPDCARPDCDCKCYCDCNNCDCDCEPKDCDCVKDCGGPYGPDCD